MKYTLAFHAEGKKLTELKFWFATTPACGSKVADPILRLGRSEVRSHLKGPGTLQGTETATERGPQPSQSLFSSKLMSKLHFTSIPVNYSLVIREGTCNQV